MEVLEKLNLKSNKVQAYAAARVILNRKIRGYLKDASDCLMCGGLVEGDSINVEGNEVSQLISCTECGAEYHDIYKLKSVEIVDYGHNFKNEVLAKVPGAYLEKINATTTV